MLLLTKYLTQKQTQAKCNFTSSKRVLEVLSNLLSQTLDLEPNHANTVFEKLIKREKLGSTGIGHGVAIPRAKDSSIQEPVIAILTLNEGIDFHAEDKRPVDILIGVLVPDLESQQTMSEELLKGLNALLTNQKFRASLREAKDNKSLYNTFLLGAVVG